ncbi:MAG: prolipoprotein diacylglyceryl transferase [Clostridia bacterium]|nr:prolipoprotein diacylglyceryl transferase [Clostridia bacterium]
MHPFINLFGMDIATYGLLTALGAMAAAMYIIFTFQNEEYNGIKMSILGLGWGLGVLFGGKILYFLTRLPEVLDKLNRATSTAEKWDAISFGFSGLVFYGGLMGGLIMTLILCKSFKMDSTKFFDYISPAIPLFHAFGRVGCFLTGCCYGIPSDFGFTTTDAVLKSCNGVNRFPVQLFEGLLNLLLFVVLFVLRKKPIKNMRRGDIFLTYILSYATLRFLLEFLRGDALRGVWFSLSTSQWISLGFIIFAIVRIIFFRKKQPILV